MSFALYVCSICLTCVLQKSYMCALYVCLICVPYMCALYVCTHAQDTRKGQWTEEELQKIDWHVEQVNQSAGNTEEALYQISEEGLRQLHFAVQDRAADILSGELEVRRRPMRLRRMARMMARMINININMARMMARRQLVRMAGGHQSLPRAGC